MRKAKGEERERHETMSVWEKKRGHDSTIVSECNRQLSSGELIGFDLFRVNVIYKT